MCATAAVFIVRGTSAENLIFVCLGIFGAALVGLAALNALTPLVTGETRQPEMVGNQTRIALEREKNLLLRSIKELEFDHAMGKVAEADFEEMSARLRSRAVRLLQELDNTTTGYRDLIERELARRLGKTGATGSTRVDPDEAKVEPNDGSTKVEPYRERSEPYAERSEQPETVERRHAPAGVDGSRASGACPSCATVNDDDARFCKSCGSKLLALVASFIIPFSFFVFSFATPASAQFQMPDPKEMSGIPRPVTDLPTGHVSVRLIRGQLSNNIQGHPVEMHAGGKVLTVKTDENGRAEFSGVAAGTAVRAVATVDGERLESHEFPWPGLRRHPRDARRDAQRERYARTCLPAATRQCRAGRSDAHHRRSHGRRDPDLLHPRHSEHRPSARAAGVGRPAGHAHGAASTTVLAGAPNAVARGDRVTVSGPFAPGQTPVEVAYRLRFDSGNVTFEQKMPLAVPNLAVLMKKVGDMSLSSPQLPNVQEREFEGSATSWRRAPRFQPAGHCR